MCDRFVVQGVRVHGNEAKDCDVTYDPTLFTEVPVANKCGIPLWCVRQPGTGGDDSKIKGSCIVRFMADPDDGFAPMEWQYGGNMGPAPPVVLARKDKIPFSVADFRCMEAYICEWLDEAADADENRAEVNEEFLTPSALQMFIRTRREESTFALTFASAFLPLQFPLGSIVSPKGLSVTELNDIEGEVAQFSRERVGVRFSQFPDRGAVALKPERLTFIQEAPLHGDDSQTSPAAKRQDTGEMKAERRKQVFRQDALAIARRFVECLLQDTFPEHGDVHLFGLGTRYQARATEVLAVWQAAVKLEIIVEDDLVDALCNENVKDFFEDMARKVAVSKAPNATYAKALVEAKFATVEWDDL